MEACGRWWTESIDSKTASLGIQQAQGVILYFSKKAEMRKKRHKQTTGAINMEEALSHWQQGETCPGNDRRGSSVSAAYESIKSNLSEPQRVENCQRSISSHSLSPLLLCVSSQTSYLATFRQIYTVGYATSLISLITAIVVFTAFRWV